MRVPGRWAGMVLPLCLTGCFFQHPHPTQSQRLAPPVVPPQPQTTPVELPPSTNTIPPEPTQNAKEQPQQPKPRHRKPKPVNNTPETASMPLPSPQPQPVSAIGQLSSGDPADYRQQTSDLINSIEHSLNNIGRSLSDPEQKTADNIREFLKQAREAITTGDVDGAHTLAVKAKVLLTELTK